MVSPNCKAKRLLVIIEFKVGGARLADFMRKTEEPGKACCIWCNQDIKYGSRGKVASTDHAKTSAHQKIFEIRKTNYSLPGFLVVASFYFPLDKLIIIISKVLPKTFSFL